MEEMLMLEELRESTGRLQVLLWAKEYSGCNGEAQLLSPLGLRTRTRLWPTSIYPSRLPLAEERQKRVAPGGSLGSPGSSPRSILLCDACLHKSAQNLIMI